MKMLEKLLVENGAAPLAIDCSQPRFAWRMCTGRPGAKQSAYHIVVARGAQVCWDSGVVKSDVSQQIPYAGEALVPCTAYTWRVRIWDEGGVMSDWAQSAFETGLRCNAGARYIFGQWIAPAERPLPAAHQPPFLVRKAFSLKKKPVRARLYVSARGLYEAYVNAEKAGQDVLTPGWTVYPKRIQYQAYDVTAQLRVGENVLGMCVADGWYGGRMCWHQGHHLYGETAAFAQLVLFDENGAVTVIASDDTWQSGTGLFRWADLYDGVCADARLEPAGWSAPGGALGDWPKAKLTGEATDLLVAQESPAARRQETLRPISQFVTPKGEVVFDMGQNMVGWLRIRVRGASGERVVISHAEVLDKDGNFYTENLRSAQQKIEYTLSGQGEEVFEPVFSYYGFRYVRIDQWPGDVSGRNIEGVVVNADMAVTGRFTCSDARVNQLQHNILWGQKGNFVDVPTDCPQRDERLGWTGDAQVFVRTACFNMDVQQFFAKWLHDLALEQAQDGGVPHVVPQVLENVPIGNSGDAHVNSNYSSAAWGDAAVICPWTIYQCYGNARLLEEQYPSMRAWVEHMHQGGDEEYLWQAGSHFGDWLGLDAKEGSYKGATDEHYIASAFFAYSTELLAKAARVLGYGEEAAHYEDMHRRIVEKFREVYCTPEGDVTVNTQTAQVLALQFGLAKEEWRARIAERLVDMLRDNNWHLTTGFVGAPYLCEALTNAGHHDAACRLFLQDTYPSWLYPLSLGATTMWEHWDNIRADGSFWSANMNSFNHYAYGSIGDWLYRFIAGLDMAAPAYKKASLRPRRLPGLSYARAQVDTPYGTLACGWEAQDASLRVTVTVPENTDAVLFLEGAAPDTLVCPAGVAARTVMGGMEAELPAGTYVFTVKG